MSPWFENVFIIEDTLCLLFVYLMYSFGGPLYKAIIQPCPLYIYTL